MALGSDSGFNLHLDNHFKRAGQKNQLIFIDSFSHKSTLVNLTFAHNNRFSGFPNAPACLKLFSSTNKHECGGLFPP